MDTRVITGLIALVAIIILGVVAYNTGWFGGEVATTTPTSPPPASPPPTSPPAKM